MSEFDPIERTAADAVDHEHPWLGLDSFTEQSSGFFYGREDEVAELARRVQRKLLTVLFGQSGLGKTSILRAGLVPRLRPEGYCPVYVRISYAPESPAPSEQIKQAILRATQVLGTWTRSGSADPGESLWEFLHHRDDTFHDFDGRPLIPVLIFDQFEEIFTLAQADEEGRRRAAEFIADLADLVENRAPRALEARMEADDDAAAGFDFARSDYRVLIALREDYLAHLEGVKGAMPSITQNRMRLARMNGRQALAAVTLPGGRLVSEEVAEAIVRFIAGGAELMNAEVEPSLLSLICRELNNNRIAQGRNEISPDLLAGSHASILSEFYARALHDQPPGVHRFIEDELLTEAGFRENLAEERVLKAFAAAGAAPDALATLVNRRLLRIEERLDARRVELTHDVLCSVVRSARDTRKERELHEEATRQLALQGERERVTRKALVRARQVVAVCVVLTIGAIGSAAFGYVNMHRAEQTRAMADAGRAEAEKLVSYLLDDFYDQLQPIGRVDIMSDLVARTADYYRRLPAAMRTADTERNRAFVLLRMGMLRRLEGKLPEAASALDESIAVLAPVVARGAASEAVVLNLAAAYAERSLVAYANSEFRAAPTLARRGVALAQPLADAPSASLAARHTYTDALSALGYIEMRNSNFAAALTALRRATAISAGPTDLRSRMAYIDAASWLLEALSLDGQLAESKPVADRTLKAIDDVLAIYPGHRVALRIKAEVMFVLGANDYYSRQPGRGLVWFDREIEADEAQLKQDPTNARIQLGVSIGYGFKALCLYRLGRIVEAHAAADASLLPYRVTAPTAHHSGNLYQYASAKAEMEADLGDRFGLERTMALVHKFGLGTAGEDVANTSARAVSVLTDELETAAVALILGQPIVSADTTAVLIAHAQQLMALSRTTGTGVDVAGFAALAYELDARRAEAAGDFVRAEASGRSALEMAGQIAGAVVPEMPVMRMEHALALARLQRHAEARALVGLALKQQRATIAAGSDDQMLRLELAQSLYVSALAQPGAGAAELKEAAALLAGLPAPMQPMRSVRLWRARVDAALRERRA